MTKYALYDWYKNWSTVQRYIGRPIPQRALKAAVTHIAKRLGVGVAEPWRLSRPAHQSVPAGADCWVIYGSCHEMAAFYAATMREIMPERQWSVCIATDGSHSISVGRANDGRLIVDPLWGPYNPLEILLKKVSPNGRVTERGIEDLIEQLEAENDR